jgi:hypothetical protein
LNSIKYPTTVRGLADMAAEQGKTLAEMLDIIGPIPMPPAGYTLAQGPEVKWIGHEMVNRRWIITPTWTVTTGRALEVWMADHEPPRYAHLSPEDALQLAADLITAARAVEDASKAEGSTAGSAE